MTPNGSLHAPGQLAIPQSLESGEGGGVQLPPEYQSSKVSGPDATRGGHGGGAAGVGGALPGGAGGGAKAGEIYLNAPQQREGAESFGGELVLADGSIADKPSPWLLQQLLASAAAAAAATIHPLQPSAADPESSHRHATGR